MKFIYLSIISVLGLCACGNQNMSGPLSAATAPNPSATPASAFQAYGSTPEQLTANSLTQVLLPTLYYGDSSEYNVGTSSFKPTIPGAYYTDVQLDIDGTFSSPTLTLFIQINYNGSWQLNKSETITVPTGQDIHEQIAINDIIYYGGPDHSEIYVSASQPCQVDTATSQWEGYWIANQPDMAYLSQ